MTLTKRRMRGDIRRREQAAREICQERGWQYVVHTEQTLPQGSELANLLALAAHQDLLLQVLSDEVARRDSLAVTLRVQHARLDPTMRLEQWDTTAKVTFDRALLNELATLRFLDAHAHVTIVGPVGVG